MRISPKKNNAFSASRSTGKPVEQPKGDFEDPVDQVSFLGKLARIGKGAVIGAAIGAVATGIGFVGALTGGTGALLGIAGAAALGIGLAHKLDMTVPSSFISPGRAFREKTFYGATAGAVGGTFGAAMAGIGLVSGAGAVAAAGAGIGYAATLAATRNTLFGIGEQFPNTL